MISHDRIRTSTRRSKGWAAGVGSTWTILKIACLFRRACPLWVGKTGFFIRYLVHGLRTLLLGCFGWGGQGQGRPRRRHGYYVCFPRLSKKQHQTSMQVSLARHPWHTWIIQLLFVKESASNRSHRLILLSFGSNQTPCLGHRSHFEKKEDPIWEIFFWTIQFLEKETNLDTKRF